ncbi:hypothetical protein ACHAL6_11730 [Proteiniclasticum sp. C24MP]|uniref:hypothetical protein n=1 Tax=Proteiniclasticum sp. C24MP TaxID=3374101 RepID=UPI003754A9F3
MDERISSVLDELDEKETSDLLSGEMEFPIDEITRRRIASSVKKRTGAERRGQRNSRGIWVVGASIMLMAFLAFFSFGEKDLVVTVRKVMEFIPGYGVASPAEGLGGDIPKQVLDLVENLRAGHNLTKEKYTIGEKGYKVNYIREIDLSRNYESMNDIMEEKEEWLFIVEDKKESYYSILIGKDWGRYTVLMSGGAAEMFYHTLSLADPDRTGEIDLLFYGGDQYLINERHMVYQIPATRMDYERNPEIFDRPLDEKICLELILVNYEESLNINPPYQLGSIGLMEQYDEMNR